MCVFTCKDIMYCYKCLFKTVRSLKETLYGVTSDLETNIRDFIGHYMPPRQHHQVMLLVISHIVYVTSHPLFLSFVIYVSMGSGSTCNQTMNAHFLIFIHQYQVLYSCVIGVTKNRWGAMWVNWLNYHQGASNY